VFFALFFIERQLYLKTLKYDNLLSWSSSDIPREAFRADRATILNDNEIFNVAAKYDIKCQLLINPGKYLEYYSFTSFAYQKDFALTEILDHHLQKFKQGLVEKIVIFWA
jgi:hypothetical protein